MAPQEYMWLIPVHLLTQQTSVKQTFQQDDELLTHRALSSPRVLNLAMDIAAVLPYDVFVERQRQQCKEL